MHDFSSRRIKDDVLFGHTFDKYGKSAIRIVVCGALEDPFDACGQHRDQREYAAIGGESNRESLPFSTAAVARIQFQSIAQKENGEDSSPQCLGHPRRLPSTMPNSSSR